MTPAELQELKARCLDLARSICEPSLEPAAVAMLAGNIERDVFSLARSICDPTLMPEAVTLQAVRLEQDVLAARAEARTLAANTVKSGCPDT